MIFHIDMDAFFASVEIAGNPQLKGKPVIVGGQPNQRGVVSTCSYEARAFGVRSAMSLTEAYRRCPHGIFLNGNYSLYREISDQIMEIFRLCTPLVEVVSIDEAYLDLAGAEIPCTGIESVAAALKEEIRRQTQLACSIGIAKNKLLAKIASSLSKPNGLLSVPLGSEEAFLAPLPIGDIPGIGKKTQEILNHDGIETIRDLQALGRDVLIDRYGAHGYFFYRAATGQDDRKVETEDSDPKSIGAEITFGKDEAEHAILMNTLKELVAKVCRRLKNYQMHAGGVTLKLRFSDFTTITRSHLLLSDTDNPEVVWEELLYLFSANYSIRTPIRLIGVSLDRLKSGYWQPSLWEGENLLQFTRK